MLESRRNRTEIGRGQTTAKLSGSQFPWPICAAPASFLLLPHLCGPSFFPGKASATKTAAPLDDRKTRKLIKTIERKIAKLDDERKLLQQQLLTETNAKKALEMHNQIEAIGAELQSAEEQWLELN